MKLSLVLLVCGVLSGLCPAARAAQPIEQFVIRNVTAIKSVILEGRIEDAKVQAQEFQQALARLGGAEHPVALEALVMVGDLHRATGGLTEAERIYQHVMGVLRKHGALGTNSDAYVTGRIGMLRLAQNRVTEAGEAIRRSLGLMDKLKTPPTASNYTTVLDALCSVYEAQGKYQDYAQTAARVVELCKKREPGGLDHLSALIKHAKALISETRLQDALNQLLAAKKIAEQQKSPASLAVIVCWMGKVVAILGDPVKAEELVRQARTYFTQGKGTQEMEAEIQGLLAILCSNNGKLEEAEALATALTKAPESIPGALTRRANAFSVLAGVAARRQDIAKARHWMDMAMSAAEKAFGKTHPELASFLFDLSDLLGVLSDTALSLPMAERALAIRKEKFGKGNSSIAISQYQVALLYSGLGRHEDAARLLKEAEAVLTKNLGKLHMRTLQCRLARGCLVFASRPDAAAAREALEIAEGMLRDLPADAPPGNKEAVLRLVTISHLRMGNAEAAVKAAEQMCASQRLYLSPSAAAGDISNRFRVGALLRAGRHEEGRAVYLAWSDALNEAVDKLAFSMNARQLGQLKATDGVFVPPVLLEDGPLLFQAIQRYKGLFMRLIEREKRLLNKAGQDARTRPMAEKISTLSSELRRQWLQQTGDTQKTTQLTTQIEQATQELLKKLPEPELDRQEMTPEELTKHLPADGALIDIVRCTFDLEAPEPGQRYAAVVLRPGEPVRFVALGDAAMIDETWERYATAVENFGDADGRILTGYHKPGASEVADFDKISLSLYDKALRPLLEACGNAAEIFLVPDGIYHQIPVAGLRDEAGSFVCEKRFVRVLSHCTDLTRPATPMRQDTNATLLGGIDYANASPVSKHKSGETNAPAARGAIATGLDFKRDYSLQGAKEEVATLNIVLGSRGVSSKLLKETATESTLRGLRAPDILHIATHSHSLKRPPFSGSSVPDVNSLLPAHEPDSLMTSTLWLAGALKTFRAWENGTFPPLADDGVLLAGEAAELNLAGTQLVALSACSSGQGEARGGIGLYGLKQAFFDAGAQNVLVTHWVLSDKKDTIELIRLFYEKFLEIRDPARALHEVQRDLLVQRSRDSDALTAVYFASPFTVTGRTVPSAGR
ncbi:MAG: CHAT domain-containing protein [Prosthecobacter sp.]